VVVIREPIEGVPSLEWNPTYNTNNLVVPPSGRCAYFLGRDARVYVIPLLGRPEIRDSGNQGGAPAARRP